MNDLNNTIVALLKSYILEKSAFAESYVDSDLTTYANRLTVDLDKAGYIIVRKNVVNKVVNNIINKRRK